MPLTAEPAQVNQHAPYLGVVALVALATPAPGAVAGPSGQATNAP